MTFLSRKRLWFATWLVVLIGITIGSLLPFEAVAGPASLIGDKFQHFGAYCLLGILSLLSGQDRRSRMYLLTISLLWSILIEVIQPATGRHFEWADIAANSAGLTASIPLMLLFGAGYQKWQSSKI